MTLNVDISNPSGDWSMLKESSIRAAACAAWNAVKDDGTESEVSIVLADDAFIQDLNARFRDKNLPTNVLSFPLLDPPNVRDGDVGDRAEDGMSLVAPPSNPGEPRHLGDIILALTTITREAEAQGKTLSDHARHLVVHGFLHLLGWDHEETAAADEMEAQEIAILAGLNIANPYESGANQIKVRI